MTAADGPPTQATPSPPPAESADRLEAAAHSARQATAQLDARLRLAARMLKCFDRLASQERARSAKPAAPEAPAGRDAAAAGAEAIDRAESIIDVAEQIERNIVSMVFRAAELLTETQSAAQDRAAAAEAPKQKRQEPIGAATSDGDAPDHSVARPEAAGVERDEDREDLAELREMNDELRTQLAALEEQYDRLVAYQSIHDDSEDLTARVLATVSDEIRTPIETIARLVELLAETGLDRSQRGYLAETRSAIGSLQELTQCVLHAPDHAVPDHPALAGESPQEAAESCVQPVLCTSAQGRPGDDHPPESATQRFDLDALLQEVVEELATIARGKGIRISASTECEAPALFGDRARLRQALLYALTRAVQCAAEGEITMRARAARRPGRSIATQFTIIGLGAAPAAREAGEAPAIAGDASPAGGALGASAGFGLNIARQLIESLGGVLGITVIDEQRFEITLTAELQADAGERIDTQTFPRMPQEGLHSNLGRVLDLSLDGMRIVGVRVPPENQPVDIELRDPDGHVKLRARVVWSRRLGFRRHEIGLRFLNITSQLAAELTRVSLNHRVPTAFANSSA